MSNDLKRNKLAVKVYKSYLKRIDRLEKSNLPDKLSIRACYECGAIKKKAKKSDVIFV